MNLQTDIVKKYFKLDSSWLANFNPKITFMNRRTYDDDPVELKLISFGSGSAMIDLPVIKRQMVPNEQLEFDERDAIRIVLSMEILR